MSSFVQFALAICSVLFNFVQNDSAPRNNNKDENERNKHWNSEKPGSPRPATEVGESLAGAFGIYQLARLHFRNCRTIWNLARDLNGACKTSRFATAQTRPSSVDGA